jgi:hypothetical protein
MPSRAERERTQQRRVLRLLADAPEGMTEALMMAHGFNSELLVDLCIAGLAIAKVERMIAGGRTVEVVRLKITEAASGRGRRRYLAARLLTGGAYRLPCSDSGARIRLECVCPPSIGGRMP